MFTSVHRNSNVKFTFKSGMCVSHATQLVTEKLTYFYSVSSHSVNEAINIMAGGTTMQAQTSVGNVREKGSHCVIAA